MTRITLESLKESADAKYGALEIELASGVLALRNPMRLSDAERARFTELSSKTKPATDKADDDTADAAEVNAQLREQQAELREMITVLADDKTLAKQFLTKVVGDDLGLLAEVMSAYGKGTKAGEA